MKEAWELKWERKIEQIPSKVSKGIMMGKSRMRKGN
jgi:hypothetical protein